jgi:hypothetical protein
MTRRTAFALALLSAALSWVPPTSRADGPPIGLTLIDLRAIRETYRDSADWFPPVSSVVRTILLDSDDATVVQFILYSDGQCYYRDATILQLRRLDGTTGDDYARLVAALNNAYFRAILKIVQAGNDAQTGDVVGGVGQMLFSARSGADHMNLTDRQKAHLDTLVGQVVEKIPDQGRQALLRERTIGPVLSRGFEAAKRLERTQIEQVSGNHAPAGTRQDTLEAIKHFNAQAGGAGASKTSVVLRPADGHDVFIMDTGPTTRLFVKPTSPAAAQKLRDTRNPFDLSASIRSGDVSVYTNRGPGGGLKRLDGQALREGIGGRTINAHVAPRPH